MNISEAKQSPFIRLFFLPDSLVHISCFTSRQCKTLSSECVFTRALSSNSHPRSLISHILQILSAPPFHICTISTFIFSFPLPLVLVILFCNS